MINWSHKFLQEKNIFKFLFFTCDAEVVEGDAMAQSCEDRVTIFSVQIALRIMLKGFEYTRIVRTYPSHLCVGSEGIIIFLYIGVVPNFLQFFHVKETNTYDTNIKVSFGKKQSLHECFQQKTYYQKIVQIENNKILF